MTSIIDLGAEETAFLTEVLRNSGEDYIISSDEGEIIRSDRIILLAPDNTADALRQLHLLNLFTIIRIYKKPFLGVCSGMHLLADHSADSSLSYLGIFHSVSETFEAKNIKAVKGTHNISVLKRTKLFEGIDNNTGFYFNNLNYIPVNNFTTSTAVNKIDFSASMEKDNFFCIQFRPEKSGEPGKKIIRNFLRMGNR